MWSTSTRLRARSATTSTFAPGGGATIEDREHVRKELEDVLRYATEVHRAHRGLAPRACWSPVACLTTWATRRRRTSTRSGSHATRRCDSYTRRTFLLSSRPSATVELVVLNQLLEACPRASEVVAELAARLPNQALLVVVYSNTASLPGRILRHNWRRFFHWKAVYFNSENLRSMLERAGLRFVAQSGLNTSYTLTRALDLVLPGHAEWPASRGAWASAPRPCACRRGPTCRSSSAPSESEASELLTVVVPVFNEAAYLRAVLDELLGKQFVIPHEVIVVESNSTDGTREIVQTFEGRPGSRSSTRTGRAAKAPPFVAG